MGLKRLIVAIPLILTACIIGPSSYQVAPTVPNGVAYCMAPGDKLDHVAEMAGQHCAAQGQRAEPIGLDSSATCSRGIYNLGGGQGQIVQYRCTAP
jgi:hypothetical protein